MRDHIKNTRSVLKTVTEGALNRKFSGPVYDAKTTFKYATHKGNVYSISYFDKDGTHRPEFDGHILYTFNGTTSVL